MGLPFHQLNIADHEAILSLEDSLADVTHVVNLAAQALRYSLINPFAYVETNVMGFVAMAELARRLPSWSSSFMQVRLRSMAATRRARLPSKILWKSQSRSMPRQSVVMS